MNFLLVSGAPVNLRCLLLVARNLKDALTTPSFSWPNVEPFQQWPALFDFLIDHEQDLCRLIGDQVSDDLHLPLVGEPKKPTRLMFGQIEQCPLFAMLCEVHETERFSADYGTLQLQVLHAHWLKLQKFREDHPQHGGYIREAKRALDNQKRDIKMPNTAARAVRSMRRNHFVQLLENLNPQKSPADFMREAEDGLPQGTDYRVIYKRIRSYCESGYAPRSEGSGGKRDRSIGKYLDVYNYTGWRYGLRTLEHREGDEGEGGGAEQEHIVNRRAPGRRSHSLEEKNILDLGLEPLELADKNPTVLTSVPAAHDRQEAGEIARALTRGFEIDRRLFPWNSKALRLEEFHKCLLPVLKDISERGSASRNELAAAAVIAISAETGRSFEEVLQLEIEDIPGAKFSFKPPAHSGECGQWGWEPVSADYRSELSIPLELESEPEPEIYLSFRASGIVTCLIEKVRSQSPLKGNKLFPYKPKQFGKMVRAWLTTKDPDKLCTLSRIAHLSWNLLHRLTDGELASECLVLGVSHPLAQVELFYAVLETSEAALLFEQSQDELWRVAPSTPKVPALMTSPVMKGFVGCRAFPMMKTVKQTVTWLREGRDAFFRLKIQGFNAERDAEILNRAVMHLVWYQFFSFGTRAIRSAYQESDGFSTKTGIGVLSDKDFATGDKTRIIFAPKLLRLHMKALESRLAELSKRNPVLKAPGGSSVWLLGPKNEPVEVTPTSIREVMGERFPFPVNTPRKVMRFMLRKAKMSHSHAEAFMGHWWHGREPFSPFFSFQFQALTEQLELLIPGCIKELEFDLADGVHE